MGFKRELLGFGVVLLTTLTFLFEYENNEVLVDIRPKPQIHIEVTSNSSILSDSTNSTIPKNANTLDYGKTTKIHKLETPYTLNSTATNAKNLSPNPSNLPTIDATILIRIYPSDNANWTIVELEQWFEYLWYAGVDTIYLYDNYKTKNESLEKFCEKFEKVVYHDWSKFHPYSIKSTQVPAYVHAWKNYGIIKAKNSTRSRGHWLIHWDMDEYPFSKVDNDSGFFRRVLALLIDNAKNPKNFKNGMNGNIMKSDVAEFSVSNYLFLGAPLLNTGHVLERYLRRDIRNVSNKLHKPIYDPTKIIQIGVHNNVPVGEAGGFAMKRWVDPEILRMNHYWGARLQGWGRDTESSLAKTRFDDSMLDTVRKMRQDGWTRF